MSVRIEKRDVKVKICDFDGREVGDLSKCVICKRDMCNAGTGKHTSHSLEVYSFKLENKICSAYVCKECAGKKTDLTIGQFLDDMFGESPVPTIDAPKGSSDYALRVATAKAAQFGARVIVLRETLISPETIGLVPANIARKYRIIPVEKVDGRFTIAIADPSDLNTIDTLTHLLNAEIEIRVASEDDIAEALLKYYPDGEVQSDEKAESLRSVGPSSDMRGIGIVD